MNIDSKNLVDSYTEDYYLKRMAGHTLIDVDFNFRRYTNLFRSYTLGLSDDNLICDIGGGRGELAKYYVSLGKKVIYADYSSAAIEIAKKFVGDRDNIQYFNIDANDLPNYVTEDSIDIIFMNDFVEHISQEELLRIIATAHKMLKDSGVLIVHTPEKYYGSVLTKDAVYPQHINLMDIEDLKASLSSMFNYVDVFTWNGLQKFYEKGKSIELFGIAVKNGSYATHQISLPDRSSLSLLDSSPIWQQIEFDISRFAGVKFLVEGTLSVTGDVGDSIGQFAIADKNGERAFCQEFKLKSLAGLAANFLQASEMSLPVKTFNREVACKLIFRVKNLAASNGQVTINNLLLKKLEKADDRTAISSSNSGDLESFNFAGHSLRYFYHRGNCGFPPEPRTERTVEIPIADKWLSLAGENVWEIGAVSCNYWRPIRVEKIIDPYDKHPSVTDKMSIMNVDLKGRRILSISTIEHIGKFPQPGNEETPDTVLKALDKIFDESPCFLITFPPMYNSVLDRRVFNGTLPADVKIRFIVRQPDQTWQEVFNPEEAKRPYGKTRRSDGSSAGSDAIVILERGNLL
jgi:Methyltransferase domain